MRRFRILLALAAALFSALPLGANAAGVDFSIKNMTGGTMHATISGEGYRHTFTLEFGHTIVLTGVPQRIHVGFISYRPGTNVEICQHDSATGLGSNGWKAEAVILTGRICYFRDL